tara:strand:+ start:44289 stop:45035 length:747 start_codon:yes stop_codon:yes gene_type:complete
MSYFQPQRFNILPPVVKNLLIINGLLFFATITLYSSNLIDLTKILGLHYWKSNNFETWQIISHMFMHGGFMHLFFNMFAVWMFGSQIENLWGSKRFLNYYLLTGLGAAFVHFIIIHLQIQSLENNMTLIQIEKVLSDGSNILNSGKNYIQNDMRKLNLLYNTPVVGASGALFGLLLAFGMLYPNALLMFLFFPFPIKAKYFVMIYGLAELYYGLQNNPNDNIAHFAHLGGMIFGFIIIKYWQHQNNNN